MANVPLKTIKFPGINNTYTIPEIDNTLTTAGKAADAKKTGDEITAIKADLGELSNLDTTNKSNIVSAINEVASSGGSGSGMTENIKIALLSCLQNVAWINGNGQTYYDALYDALYPPAEVVSITAVYTPTRLIFDDSSLNELKNDLVVTAFFDDSTSHRVLTYTLSGTLVVGTSTITVSYEGKTTTFTVTVLSSSYISDGLVMWLDGEYNGQNGEHNTSVDTWYDQSGNGWDWTASSTFDVGANNYMQFSNKRFQRETKPTDVETVEIVMAAPLSYTTNRAVVTGFTASYKGNVSLVNNRVCFDTTASVVRIMDEEPHTFNNFGYIDGVMSEDFETSGQLWQWPYPAIGNYRGNTGEKSEYAFNGKVYAIRMYNRALTTEELLHNATVDMRRFGI